MTTFLGSSPILLLGIGLMVLHTLLARAVGMSFLRKVSARFSHWMLFCDIALRLSSGSVYMFLLRVTAAHAVPEFPASPGR